MDGVGLKDIGHLTQSIVTPILSRTCFLMNLGCRMLKPRFGQPVVAGNGFSDAVRRLQIRLCPTEIGMIAYFNCQRLSVLCLIHVHGMEADALSACFGDFSGNPICFQSFPASVDSVVSCDLRGLTG